MIYQLHAESEVLRNKRLEDLQINGRSRNFQVFESLCNHCHNVKRKLKFCILCITDEL